MILILSFHQFAIAQVQRVTGDKCLERFGMLNGSSLRQLMKSQPESAVMCVDALLNGYAEFEGAGRAEEATRFIRLADRLARTYSAIWNKPLLTAQVALYRRWSPTQKREKLQADDQWYVGQELYSKGDVEGALKVWLESVEVEKRLGDAWGEAGSLTHLAVIYHGLRRDDEALVLQRRSLELNQRIGYMAGMADNLLYIGDINEEKTPAYARALYLRALGMKIMAKDVRGEINALIHLATLYESLNQPQNAAKFYRKLLAVQDKSRHWDANLLAHTLRNMGGLFLKLGLQRDADAAMRQLEELLQQVGVDAVVSGQVLTDVAELYEKAGQPDAAGTGAGGGPSRTGSPHLRGGRAGLYVREYPAGGES